MPHADAPPRRGATTQHRTARDHARAAQPAPHGRAATTFEVTGPSTAPLIVALGGISSTRHVTATEADGSPGWWEAIVGPARAIDTTAYRVASIDYLDGGAGDDGRPATRVSTHDQADALATVLDALGTERIHALVGASYGGMVGLAFAERYPARVERLVITGAAHEPHPMTTALRAVQRRIVQLGLETGREHDALALARALAMTTYRSPREFGERFATEPDAITAAEATFPVERYLLHHGEKFARSWSAARFLALSLSADLHRVDPRRITTPTAILAVRDDAIVPAEQLDQLESLLSAPLRVVPLDVRTGHDAFLAEPDIIGPALRDALNAPIHP